MRSIKHEGCVVDQQSPWRRNRCHLVACPMNEMESGCLNTRHAPYHGEVRVGPPVDPENTAAVVRGGTLRRPTEYGISQRDLSEKTQSSNEIARVVCSRSVVGRADSREW